MMGQSLTKRVARGGTVGVARTKAMPRCGDGGSDTDRWLWPDVDRLTALIRDSKRNADRRSATIEQRSRNQARPACSYRVCRDPLRRMDASDPARTPELSRGSRWATGGGCRKGGRMQCPRCQGLMIEELIADFADVEAVVQEHCILCGHIQYPQACCDTTHELHGTVRR